jgi:protein O-mannosyl-transferase
MKKTIGKLNNLISSHSNYKWLFFPLILLIVGIPVYYPAFQTGFLSDDYNALSLFKQEGFRLLYYKMDTVFMPVMMFICGLLYQIFGLDPLGYHVFNFLCHCLNAILLAVLVNKIMSRYQPEFHFRNYIPWICGLFFFLNPYQTEAVSWISGMAYPISLIFSLGTLIFFLSWLENGKIKNLLISGIMYLLAILSKEVMIVIPAIILMLTIIDFLFRKEIRARQLHINMAYVALTFGLLLGIYFIFRYFSINEIIGHYGKDVHLNFDLKQIFFTLAAYHLKFFFVYRFLPEWMYEVARFFHKYDVFLIIVLHFFIIFCAFLSNYIRRFFYPKMILSAAFFYFSFLISLLTVLNLEYSFLGEIQSDRYGYFASVFYSASIVFLFFSIKALRKVWILLLIIPLIWFSLCTYFENIKWRTSYQVSMQFVKSISAIKYDGKEIYMIGPPDTYHGVYTFRSGFGDFLAINNVYYGERIKVLTYARIINETAQWKIEKKGKIISIISENGNSFTRSRGQFSVSDFIFFEKSSKELQIFLNNDSLIYSIIYIVNPDGSIQKITGD